MHCGSLEFVHAPPTINRPPRPAIIFPFAFGAVATEVRMVQADQSVLSVQFVCACSALIGGMAASPIGRAPLTPTLSLIASVALFSASLAAILAVRWLDQRVRDTQRQVYQLTFPKSLTFDQVTAFVRSLTALLPEAKGLFGRDAVVFETISRAEGFEHRMRVPGRFGEPVLSALRSLLPEVRTTLVERPVTPRTFASNRIGFGPWTGMLRLDQVTSFAAALLSAFTPLHVGEASLVLDEQYLKVTYNRRARWMLTEVMTLSGPRDRKIQPRDFVSTKQERALAGAPHSSWLSLWV